MMPQAANGAFVESAIIAGSLKKASSFVVACGMAQEGMCLERAAAAKREMEYWRSETAEWKTLRESSDPLRDRIAVQLDWCADSNSH
jgi:hypothetical protein